MSNNEGSHQKNNNLTLYLSQSQNNQMEPVSKHQHILETILKTSAQDMQKHPSKQVVTID